MVNNSESTEKSGMPPKSNKFLPGPCPTLQKISSEAVHNFVSNTANDSIYSWTGSIMASAYSRHGTARPILSSRDFRQASSVLQPKAFYF